MKTKDVAQRLTELGWTPFRDDVVNDWTAVRVFDDRIVTLGFAVRSYGDRRDLIMVPTVTTEAFDTAYQNLDAVHRPRRRTSGAKPGRGAALVVRLEGRSILPRITVADVDAAEAEGVAWAFRQDLAAALAEKLALPTTALGNRPLCHLAALAITGDVDRLQHYSDSFARGDRLGFVPYVSAAHIARALALAEGYHRTMAGS